jgi:hypothetical protein
MRPPVINRVRTARLGEPLALSAVFLAAATAPAFAYIDPGTGSMMLQLMLGGVAGVMVVGKLYFRRATDFFRQIGRRRRAG